MKKHMIICGTNNVAKTLLYESIKNMFRLKDMQAATFTTPETFFERMEAKHSFSNRIVFVEDAPDIITVKKIVEISERFWNIAIILCDDFRILKNYETELATIIHLK